MIELRMRCAGAVLLFAVSAFAQTQFRHGRLANVSTWIDDMGTVWSASQGYAFLAIQLPTEARFGKFAIDYLQDHGFERTTFVNSNTDGWVLLRLSRHCIPGEEYGNVANVRVVWRTGNGNLLGPVLYDGLPPDLLPCKGAAIPVATRRRRIVERLIKE